MKAKLDDDPRIVALALKAIEMAGIEPVVIAHKRGH
jgi:hypothetical protein